MSTIDTGRDEAGDSPANPEELAVQLRSGSLIALRVVSERIRRILNFRGFRMPAEDRKDLEQEIMIQIWQAVNRPTFDDRAGFWGFVEVVATRRSIDWLRARKPTDTLDERIGDSQPGPLRTLLQNERTRLANAALSRLEAPCRELVQLHVGQGKPYRELARQLGKSEGALRVQMYRCIRQLRDMLEEMTAPAKRDDTMAEVR